MLIIHRKRVQLSSRSNLLLTEDSYNNNINNDVDTSDVSEAGLTDSELESDMEAQ